MSELGAAQSPITAAQIVARLLSMDPSALRDVAAAIPPAVTTPIGLTIFASQSIQAARMAQGWAVPPGVKLFQNTFCR